MIHGDVLVEDIYQLGILPKTPKGQVMAPDTITLMLEGDVTLETFATAVKSLDSLIGALTVGEGGGIEWKVEDLQPGSALATIKGYSPHAERVERVVRGYSDVGRALRENVQIHRGRKISGPAMKLGRLVGDGVKRVRFETQEETVVLHHPPARRPRAADNVVSLPGNGTVVAFGAVEGEVQTLTKRNVLRFTLYDALNDRPVSCYLQSGQEDLMREVWGKHAIVEGLVNRDPTDGHPIAVRQVSKITPKLEEGDYTQARAILPLKPDAELPEVTIMRLRDG